MAFLVRQARMRGATVVLSPIFGVGSISRICASPRASGRCSRAGSGGRLAAGHACPDVAEACTSAVRHLVKRAARLAAEALAVVLDVEQRGIAAPLGGGHHPVDALHVEDRASSAAD